MYPIEQTQLHRVYLAERAGDTLVVTPRGDAAGFSIVAVNTEMATIETLANSGEFRHLIVDLSGGNYFGSVVLGALVRLGNLVRNRGGRIAICGASTDMQDILRLMKLDHMWEMFRDRPAASRAIARVPLSDRVWLQRKPIAIIAAVAVLAVLFFLIPWPKYGRSDYAMLNDLWGEVEGQRETAGVDAWGRLEKKCAARIEPLIERLEATSQNRSLHDAEPFVLYAARDHWMQAMQRRGNLELTNSHRIMVQYYLRCAEARLEGRPLPNRLPSLGPSNGPSETVNASPTDLLKNPMLAAPTMPEIAPPAIPVQPAQDSEPISAELAPTE